MRLTAHRTLCSNHHLNAKTTGRIPGWSPQRLAKETHTHSNTLAHTQTHFHNKENNCKINPININQGRSHGCARVCRCHPQWQLAHLKQMQNYYFFNRNKHGQRNGGASRCFSTPKKDQSTTIAPIIN